MARDFRHVLTSLYGHPWAIHAEKFRELEAVVWARIKSGRPLDDVPPHMSIEAVSTLSMEQRADLKRQWEALHTGIGRGSVETRAAMREEEDFRRIGDVAVVSIFGTISNRPSIFTSYSGGCSAEEIGRAVETAAADRTIRAIVLDVDSPGGSVYGIQECAAKILAARDRKKITAVANPVAASAAYWLASQASEFVVAPSGQVGSIGVLMAHTDESKAEEMAGLQTTLIHSGEHKAEMWKPLTADAIAALQATSDQYYDTFIRAVAAGRKTTLTDARENFGKGRMLTAKDALAAGMVDRVATMEDVLNELAKSGSKGPRASIEDDRGRRDRAAQLAEKCLPTA